MAYIARAIVLAPSELAILEHCIRLACLHTDDNPEIKSKMDELARRVLQLRIEDKMVSLSIYDPVKLVGF